MMRVILIVVLMLAAVQARGAVSQPPTNWRGGTGGTNSSLDGIATVNGLAAINTLTLNGNTAATSASKLSAFAATTSAELAGVISDETGTGPLVLGTAPTIASGLTLTGVAAASLPSNGAGKIIYCTDALTPQGTGSLVWSDGTSWRLGNGTVATTSAETYLISLIGRIQGDGQFDFGWTDHFAGSGQSAATAVGTMIIRVPTATGTGASISVAGINVTGAGGALTLTSGTDATGKAGWRSAAFDLVNQGYGFCAEDVFNLSALSTAADEYWIFYGSTDQATVGATTDANIIGFLYDRNNAWSTSGGTATNWKILTRKLGVGTTITETSTAVATGAHCLRLYRTAAGTTAHFYLDGVQVGGDVTSNLPASLSSLRLGFDLQNTAHAGAAVSCNQIVVGYAGRRTSALYQ